MPLFSVIMPCYNYGHFLDGAVTSVARQTDPDWELIVVDDGSTDDTWTILSGFDNPQIRPIRLERNQGIAQAFNTALETATGDWICNLDADDRYLPAFLERQRQFLDNHPDVDVSATWVREIDAAGIPVSGVYEQWFNRHWDLNDPSVWIYQNPICHNSTVVRRSLHEELGGEHPAMRSSVDWEKWVRMLDSGARFGLIPEVLVESRLHGANMSQQGTRRALDDWAVMTRDTARPWLRRIGRDDLAARNLAQFLAEESLADMTSEQIAVLLGTATGLDPATLPHLAAGIREAASIQRDRAADVAEMVEAYDRHVESLLADYSAQQADLDAARMQLRECQAHLQQALVQLQSVRESRSYRLGQAARRALP